MKTQKEKLGQEAVGLSVRGAGIMPASSYARPGARVKDKDNRNIKWIIVSLLAGVPPYFISGPLLAGPVYLAVLLFLVPFIILPVAVVKSRRWWKVIPILLLLLNISSAFVILMFLLIANSLESKTM